MMDLLSLRFSFHAYTELTHQFHTAMYMAAFHLHIKIESGDVAAVRLGARFVHDLCLSRPEKSSTHCPLHASRLPGRTRCRLLGAKCIASKCGGLYCSRVNNVVFDRGVHIAKMSASLLESESSGSLIKRISPESRGLIEQEYVEDVQENACWLRLACLANK